MGTRACGEPGTAGRQRAAPAAEGWDVPQHCQGLFDSRKAREAVLIQAEFIFFSNE